MFIQSTAITVTYKRIEGIKKVYYNNEDILKDFFNEATVLPVPDEAPVEIPRIIIKTLHEHAQLNISPVATTFEVRYDGGFEKDWKACSEYIQDRMDKVFKFLNILTNNQYEYIGLVSNIIYDDIKVNGTKKISEVLLKSENIHNLNDINIRYTFVEQNCMFVNIMLQNARIFKNGIIIDSAGALNQAEQEAEYIGAIIDINDRYGFNNFKDYISDSTKLKELIDCMTVVVDSKLQNLIEKGEY